MDGAQADDKIDCFGREFEFLQSECKDIQVTINYRVIKTKSPNNEKYDTDSWFDRAEVGRGNSDKKFGIVGNCASGFRKC